MSINEQEEDFLNPAFSSLAGTDRPALADTIQSFIKVLNRVYSNIFGCCFLVIVVVFSPGVIAVAMMNAAIFAMYSFLKPTARIIVSIVLDWSPCGRVWRAQARYFELAGKRLEEGGETNVHTPLLV